MSEFDRRSPDPATIGRVAGSSASSTVAQSPSWLNEVLQQATPNDPAVRMQSLRALGERLAGGNLLGDNPLPATRPVTASPDSRSANATNATANLERTTGGTPVGVSAQFHATPQRLGGGTLQGPQGGVHVGAWNDPTTGTNVGADGTYSSPSYDHPASDDPGTHFGIRVQGPNAHAGVNANRTGVDADAHADLVNVDLSGGYRDPETNERFRIGVGGNLGVGSHFGVHGTPTDHSVDTPVFSGGLHGGYLPDDGEAEFGVRVGLSIPGTNAGVSFNATATQGMTGMTDFNPYVARSNIERGVAPPTITAHSSHDDREVAAVQRRLMAQRAAQAAAYQRAAAAHPENQMGHDHVADQQRAATASVTPAAPVFRPITATQSLAPTQGVAAEWDPALRAQQALDALNAGRL
jgi:hypothetical protein